MHQLFVDKRPSMHIKYKLDVKFDMKSVCAESGCSEDGIYLTKVKGGNKENQYEENLGWKG